jgi:peptidoglycan/LPS O-acetylase OafA/YrhL
MLVLSNKRQDKVRFYQIDGLRGIAALGVVLFHLTNGSNSYYGETFAFDYGGYGVALFFAISGFVISLSLNSKDTLLAFLKARFIRLYPTFWLCVIFSYIVVSRFGENSKKVTATDLLLNFSMIPKFLGAKSFVDGVYWTLQIELLFYLAIALLFYFSRKNPLAILIYFMGASLLFGQIEIFDVKNLVNSMDPLIKSIYWRLYGLLNIEYNYLFLIGIAIFNVSKYHPKSTVCRLSWLSLVLANFTALTVSLEVFAVAIVVTSLLFFSLTFSPLKKLLSSKILYWFGSISYILYLIHTNVGRIIIEYSIEFTNNINLSVIVGLIAMIAVASIFTFYIEMPIQKFLSKKLAS